MPKTYLNDDQFMMYSYKIKLCTRIDSHSWKHCPWRHVGEVSAQRRHPSLHRPVMCMNLKLAGECAEGDACPFSHNAFELSLHPERYKTTLCNLKDKCNRELCFFAHSEQDVRTPEPALPLAGSTGAPASGAAVPQMQQAVAAQPEAQLRSSYTGTAGLSPSLGLLQQQQQQQQQQMVFVPQAVHHQQQQQQQQQQQPVPQVVVLHAPQPPGQQQGVWTAQQAQQAQAPQVHQAQQQLGSASTGGSATGVRLMIRPSQLQAAAAAGVQAGNSATVLSPVASAGTASGFISRVLAGGAGRGGGRRSFEAMVRQDLTKFDSFTMQGVEGMHLGDASVQQAWQQPQQQQQVGVMPQGLANLDAYADVLAQMSLTDRVIQQPGVLVQQSDVSYTSQGGSSNRSGPIQLQAQQPQVLQQGQQQHGILVHQDLCAFDSFTSQASAGSHSSGPCQQQAQQARNQLMFGTTYSDPFYYDPSHSEASTTTNMVMGGGSGHALQTLPIPVGLGDAQIPVSGCFQTVQDTQGAVYTQLVGSGRVSGGGHIGASGAMIMGGPQMTFPGVQGLPGGAGAAAGPSNILVYQAVQGEQQAASMYVDAGALQQQRLAQQQQQQQQQQQLRQQQPQFALQQQQVQFVQQHSPQQGLVFQQPQQGVLLDQQQQQQQQQQIIDQFGNLQLQPHGQW